MSASPPSQAMDLDTTYLAKTVIEMTVRVGYVEKVLSDLALKSEQLNNRITEIEATTKGQAQSLNWIGWGVGLVATIAALIQFFIIKSG
jgi:hypothetical protein